MDAAAAWAQQALFFGCIARALRMGAQEQAALRARFGAATLPEAGIDSLMAVELREAVRGSARDVRYHAWKYYWALEYVLV